MSFSTQNDADRNCRSNRSRERRYALIASLPAPEGIADRVKTAFAPRPSSRVSFRGQSSGKARAGRSYQLCEPPPPLQLFCGRWGGVGSVFAHPDLAPEPAAVATPQRIDGAAVWPPGSRRTPKTLEGPVVVAPPNAKQRSDVGDKAMPAKSQNACSA